MYTGLGALGKTVLFPIMASEPVSPSAKLAASWYTPVQSAALVQLPLPSLDANTYTNSAVESTIGPCTMPTPPSELEKSNWPEVVTAAVLGLTRYKKPTTSATNTSPDVASKTGLVKAVAAPGFTCTGQPPVLTSAGGVLGVPLNTGWNWC